MKPSFEIVEETFFAISSLVSKQSKQIEGPIRAIMFFGDEENSFINFNAVF